MTLGELKSVADQVNFTSVQVSPGNDGSKGDPTTVHSVTVVPNPGDCIRDARIDSTGSQKDRKIRQGCAFGDRQNEKPEDTNTGHANIENAPLFLAIRIVSNNNSLTRLD